MNFTDENEEERMQQFVAIVKPDPEAGGFVATIPGLPGVIGRGETEEEALNDARAALESELEAAGDEGLIDGDADPEGTQRPFDAQDTLEALAAEQGVSAAVDFDALLGDFLPEDEDRDDFVSALRRWRSDAPTA